MIYYALLIGLFAYMVGRHNHGKAYADRTTDRWFGWLDKKKRDDEEDDDKDEDG